MSRLTGLGIVVLTVVAAAVAPFAAAVAAPAMPTAVAASNDILPAQFWSDDQTRRERGFGNDRRPGVFRFLFRDDRRQRAAPSPPEWLPDGVPPRKREASKPRREKRKKAAAPAAPKIVAVEKAADAKRILVIGDFVAGALAKGLTASYLQNASRLVIDQSSGSSGLVRRDYHDWSAELATLMAERKPDAILVLIGANDRQTIDSGTGAQALGSEGWRTAYAARVGQLADALRGTQKPVLWAGLTPVKSTAMSRDYSTLNAIVREQLERRSLRYVDTWEGFTDEDGKYVSAGPDINGQRVQLRSSDGLNFTKAGQRKLAFFVEQQLGDLLGDAADPLLALGAPGSIPGAPVESGPRIGPMVPLDALLTSNSDTLSGGASAGLASAPGGAVTASIAADPSDPQGATPPGRADDYTWPLQPAAAVKPAAAIAAPVLPPAVTGLTPR